jgi:hypothetical protein
MKSDTEEFEMRLKMLLIGTAMAVVLAVGVFMNGTESAFASNGGGCSKFGETMPAVTPPPGQALAEFIHLVQDSSVKWSEVVQGLKSDNCLQ